MENKKKHTYFYLKNTFRILIITATILPLTSIASKMQTLEYVINETLIRNPNILAAQAETRASEADLKAAKGEFLFKLDTRASAGYGNYTTKVDEFETSAHGQEKELNAYFNQPIYSGLSTVNQVRQSKEYVKAAKFNESAAKQQLAFEAANAYLSVLQAKDLVSISKANINQLQQILGILKKSPQSQDYLSNSQLTQGRIDQSLSMLSSAEKALRYAKIAFNRIAGFEPGELEKHKLPPLPANLDIAKKNALACNPYLQSFQASVKAANYSLAISKSRMQPTLGVEINAGVFQDTYGIDGEYKDVRGMLVANYNIANGGSDLANIDAANERRIATMERYREQQRIVIENVSQAWDALTTDKDRLPELQSHVNLSQGVFNSYKDELDKGEPRSVLDVLNTQSEVHDSQVDLLYAQYAIQTDSYSLLESIGSLVNVVLRNGNTTF